MNPVYSQRAQLIMLSVLCASGIILLYGFLPYTYSHLTQLTSVFGALWAMWRFYPDFEHGMIVPLLSAFVVYTRRRELSILPINGWWPGIVCVILSLAIFWAGRRVDNQYLGFFSLQLLLAALVLWLLGWKWLQALAFPLAFLVFTWPMPFLDNIVTFPLRMFMSNMSASTMNALGIPVVQNGSGILSAPNPGLYLSAGELFSVDVANPCSGIRSLFALMMVSALYANFALRTPWKRAVLFLCSIPLAIAGNLVRILILTLGIITLGAPTAIGSLEHPTWFHEGAGFAVFIIALSGMLLICKALNTKIADWRSKWVFLSKKMQIKAVRPVAQQQALSEDLY